MHLPGVRGRDRRSFQSTGNVQHDCRERAGGMILHVLNSSKVGGVEGAILRNISRLGEPVAHRVPARGAVPGGTAGRDYAAALGLPVCEIQVRSRIDRQAVRELAQAFARLAPRIVHAHDVQGVHLRAPRREAGRPRRRAVLDASTASTAGPTARRGSTSASTRRSSCRVPTGVLAVSLADGEELAEALGPRVRVHLNGIDGRRVAPEDWPRARAAIRAAWPALPEGAAILGVVARLSPEKGHGSRARGLRRAATTPPGAALAPHLLRRRAAGRLARRDTPPPSASRTGLRGRGTAPGRRRDSPASTSSCRCPSPKACR